MQDRRTRLIAHAGIIAAIYVVITYMLAPISFGQIQFRISEALTILPLFTPAAVPGLFIGCLIGNIIGGAVLPDVIFGSLATLIGALGTYALRNKPAYYGTVPPVVSNALIIPFVLKYAYGIPFPIPLMMVTVGVGEAMSCGVLGMILYYALLTRKDSIFEGIDRVKHSDEDQKRDDAPIALAKDAQSEPVDDARIAPAVDAQIESKRDEEYVKN